MTILEALQKENIRVSNGNRWLIVNDNGQFEVIFKEFNRRPIKIVYTGNSESAAVDALLGYGNYS